MLVTAGDVGGACLQGGHPEQQQVRELHREELVRGGVQAEQGGLAAAGREGGQGRGQLQGSAVKRSIGFHNHGEGPY